MLGFDAVGRLALGQLPRAQSQVLFSWFAPLGEPVRNRPGLVAAAQQFSALIDPFPFVSFSWFQQLSIPSKRTLPGPSPSQQLFLAFHPAPSPFVATGWFEALSEPVRFLPGLKPPQQQFLAYRDNPTTVTPFAWFAPLGEPMRFLPGLKAARQQFLAAPSQLRPNPRTSGILNALETKDTMVAGGSIWNRVTSGEIGIIENAQATAEIGVSANRITSARISISII